MKLEGEASHWLCIPSIFTLASFVYMMAILFCSFEGTYNAARSIILGKRKLTLGQQLPFNKAITKPDV
jgi:hypothetical protein